MKRLTPLYRALAEAVQAIENCRRAENSEWLARHTSNIKKLCKQHMPSGSGFDNGTKLDFDKSDAERLVFIVGFHHMTELGHYDGWTEHEVFVTASLTSEIKLRITGRDRNDIKALMFEVFDSALRELVNPWPSEES